MSNIDLPTRSDEPRPQRSWTSWAAGVALAGALVAGLWTTLRSDAATPPPDALTITPVEVAPAPKPAAKTIVTPLPVEPPEASKKPSSKKRARRPPRTAAPISIDSPLPAAEPPPAPAPNPSPTDLDAPLPH
jgi:hypothetical protein